MSADEAPSSSKNIATALFDAGNALWNAGNASKRPAGNATYAEEKKSVRALECTSEKKEAEMKKAEMKEWCTRGLKFQEAAKLTADEWDEYQKVCREEAKTRETERAAKMEDLEAECRRLRAEAREQKLKERRAQVKPYQAC